MSLTINNGVNDYSEYYECLVDCRERITILVRENKQVPATGSGTDIIIENALIPHTLVVLYEYSSS